MAQGISVGVDTLLDKYREIEVIDQQLDAASGSEQAGKRAVANQLATENESSWKRSADNLLKNLSGIEDVSVLVGTVTAFQRILRENFGETIDKFLTDYVAANKTEQVTLSPEELEALTTSRKQLVEEYKAIANILEMFQFDYSEVPVPKKRTGSRGPRGPRVFGRYVYSIDGTERTASQNSLSSIANTVCSDLNWKTVDLRNFLVENGFNVDEPPQEFSVQIPAPVDKTLSMVMKEESEEEEEAEEEEVEPENE